MQKYLRFKYRIHIENILYTFSTSVRLGKKSRGTLMVIKNMRNKLTNIPFIIVGASPQHTPSNSSQMYCPKPTTISKLLILTR